MNLDQLMGMLDVFDFAIAIGYTVFASTVVVVIAYYIFPWIRSYIGGILINIITAIAVVGTVIFLLGCAGDHMFMINHRHEHPEAYHLEHVSQQFFVKIPQLVGVWAPSVLVLIINRAALAAIRARELDKRGG